MKDEQFYIAQKAFIKKGDEVLVLHDPEEGLDFPGGKIQKGESDIILSLQREVREETGIEINIIKPFKTWVETFPLGNPLAGNKVYLVGYHCEYVSGEVTLSSEHDKSRWVNKDNYNEVDDGTSYFEVLKGYFELN